MHKSKVDVWVGLLVVIGVLAIAFLGLKSANLLQLNWQPTYQITARFDNIGGLKPQAAVKSAGVVVGRVKSIRFDTQTFQAQVVLDMQQAYAFPNDSSLKILTSGLLGEQYIGVQAGYGAANWQGGETITQTQSAVVLESLISQFLFNQTANKSSAPQ
jgi:phospholipid/cholesterol/gamma-HCH transport system substrate-binding protein